MDEERTEKSHELTCFQPLSPVSEPSSAGFLWKLFGFGKAPDKEPVPSSISWKQITSEQTERAEQKQERARKDATTLKEKRRPSASQAKDIPILKRPKAVSEVTPPGRTLQTVLSTIGNMADVQRGAKPKETLKQYWMPDENCKSCYDCRAVFSTFRRRHHCRVCGQIFCSRCCWETVPGHLMGMIKDLRVCNYCSRIVKDYAQSSGIAKVIRRDLHESSVGQLGTPVHHRRSIDMNSPEPKASRSAFDGEEFRGKLLRPSGLGSISQDSTDSSPPPSDFLTPLGQSALQFGATPQKSIKERGVDLREIWFEIQRPELGLLQAHRYRLRSYPNTLVASEIVDWLMQRGCAGPNRSQASLIGQALLDSKRIEHIAGEVVFKDEYALYRPGLIGGIEIAEAADAEKRRNADDEAGPEWFRSLSTATREQESPCESGDSDNRYLYCGDACRPSSVSPRVDSLPIASLEADFDYTDDRRSPLHIECDGRHPSISGAIGSESGASTLQAALTNRRRTNSEGNRGIVGLEQRYLFTSLHGQRKQDNFERFLRSALRMTDSGVTAEGEGEEASTLRDSRNERIAIDRLNRCHKNHFDVLLRQQLVDLGLPSEWFDIVQEVAHKISRRVRPDYREDDHMDVRKYIKYKKIPDKTRTFSYVSGVVFTKTVAHKKMASSLRRPKVLLLRCALEYERVENKFSSLDTLRMQERQHLQSLVERITNLHPNIVLVEKSVSQIARGCLHNAGVVLVFNVKPKVMERLARCTQATLVAAIDQLQFDQVRLGTCELFRLTDYTLHNGRTKTLMSFEGCSETLGCTIILHGDKHQLPAVKQLLNTAVLTAYSLLMEMQLHLDMFAMPPPFEPAFYSEVEALLDSEVSRVSTPTLYPCIPDDEYRLVDTYEEELLVEKSPGYVISDDEEEFKVIIVEDDDESSGFCTEDIEAVMNGSTEDSGRRQETNTEDGSSEIVITNEFEPSEGPAGPNMELMSEGTTVNRELNADSSNSGGTLDGVHIRLDPFWTREPSEQGDGQVGEQRGALGDTSGDVSSRKSHGASIGDVSNRKSPWDDQLTCSPLLRRIAYSTQFIVSADDISDQSNISITRLLPEGPSCFLRCLMQVLLTTSPHITIPLPYVETAAGSTSNIRPFLPNVVYFSKRFKPQQQQVTTACCFRNSLLSSASVADSEIYEEKDWGEPHPFITEVLKKPVTTPSCAAQLANFRAVGGRVGVQAPSTATEPDRVHVQRPDKLAVVKDNTKTLSYSGSLHPNGSVQTMHLHQAVPNRNLTQPSIPRPVKYERKIDCLDLDNHQRFLVLFSSQSSASINAPNPCIHPWVVTMVFYGKNDIALGGFLNRYCFRVPYSCAIQTCGADMVKHQRHFVHGRGFVHLILEHMDKPLAGFEDKILCWTWCKRCRQPTAVSKLSDEAQAFSFAKYLELRFYGRNYGCRQLGDVECRHSLHQDHVHFFSYGQVIASFEHHTIGLLEVVIPAIEVTLETHGYEIYNWQQHLKEVSEYFLSFYKVVQERLDEMAALVNLPVDIEEQVDLMRRHLEGEKSELLKNMLKLKDRARKLGLISTTESNYPVIVSHLAACEVIDSSNELKRACCDRVNYWNRALYELHLRKSDRGRKSTTSKLTKNASALPLGKEEIDQYDIVRLETSPSSSTMAIATPSPPASGQEQSQTRTKEERDAECRDPTETGGNEGSSSMFMVGSNGNLQTEESHPVTAVTGKESVSTSMELSGAVSPTVSTTPFTSKSVKFLRKSNSSGLVSSGSMSAGSSEKSKTRRHAQSLLSRFLPDSSFQPLLSPIPPTEHHGLPMTKAFPVPVYDGEPSSIVAYTLSSKEYCEKLKILQFNLQASERCSSDPNRSRLPSPRVDDIAASMREDYYSQTPGSSECPTPTTSASKEKESIKSAILSVFRPVSSDRQDDSAGDTGDSELPSEIESMEGSREASPAVENAQRKADSLEKRSRNSGLKSDDEGGKGTDETDYGLWTPPVMSETDQRHITYQYTSDNYKFYCRVFFAEQFRKYREVAFPDGEERYVRSLSRCCVWAARGGKSGSKFLKTLDDRFIVKQLSRAEMQSFMQFAQHYFEYMENAHSSKVPTVIAKILGVYRIGFKNSQTNTSLRQDVLIMENLFYGRRISRIFDLKGSERNRYVQSKGQNDVLMDENLLEFVCESPLFIRPHAKTVLTRSILNDTEFLAKQFVMDYSLLVGIDETRSELVVGIIDFIRTFTLDKRLEMWVKSTGLLGGHGKMPTVVSPDVYRKRFCEAMDRYFLMVPDKWSAVGADVDWECREFD